MKAPVHIQVGAASVDVRSDGTIFVICHTPGGGSARFESAAEQEDFRAVLLAAARLINNEEDLER